MAEQSKALADLIKAGLSGDRTGFRTAVSTFEKEANDAGDGPLRDLISRAAAEADKEKGAFEDKTDAIAMRAAFDNLEVSLDDIPIGLKKEKTDALISEMILKPEIVRNIEEIVDEQTYFQDFLEHGLKPRNKLLLFGPPGNGKTQVTKAFANIMKMPLYFVRYDALISKEEGQTSKNLSRCFEFAKRHRCIMFFDEIDAIAKERSNPKETEEMKRVVSTLLVQLDDVPPHVICIGATNHAGMLDRAFLRRFHLGLRLPGPSVDEYARFLEMRFKKYNHAPAINFRVYGLAIEVENYAEAEIFVDDCVRRWVMAKRSGGISIEDAVEITLDNWPKARAKIPA